MKKIDELEEKKDYASASRALSELIEKHEEGLMRAEPFLESLQSRADVEPEKLQKIHEKITDIHHRLNSLRSRFESISQKIISIEKYKYPETAPISDYKEAIKYIKKLIKEEKYSECRHALHELLLKHKSALGYGEILIRKYRTLEASNLVAVSVKAAKRIESAQKTTVILQDRISEIEEFIHYLDAEDEKQKIEESKRRALRDFEDQKVLAVKYMNEGKHALAIGIARKLLAEHPKDKGVEKIFNKIEKAFNTAVKKEKKEKEAVDVVDKILLDAGVGIIEDEKSPLSMDALKESFVNLGQQLKKMLKKDESELARNKAYKEIENLLVKHNGVSELGGEKWEVITSDIKAIKAGFVRDFTNFKLPGFDFYGKILGKDEVTGDAFGTKRYDEEGRTIFYLGDATGHGIQASLTVAVTSKVFFETTQSSRSLQEIVMTINNDLKKKIQGRYFLTGVFFEWIEKDKKLRFIGGGHDPLYVYRQRTRTLEKVIPGGLAIGVRIITNIDSLKIREIDFEEWDILFGYTDGIIEARNNEGEIYSLARLEQALASISQKEKQPEKLYAALMEELEVFREGRAFEDDVSLYIFVRNSSRDIMADPEEIKNILGDLKASEKMMRSNKFKNMTREEIEDKVNKERYQLELKARLARLEQLYELGEFFRLKQEVIQRLKEGYVHPKMKFYLEESIKNEQSFIRKKQDEKLSRRYKTIMELYKKGQYDIVIKEALDVVSKNGKI